MAAPFWCKVEKGAAGDQGGKVSQQELEQRTQGNKLTSASEGNKSNKAGHVGFLFTTGFKMRIKIPTCSSLQFWEVSGDVALYDQP